MKVLINVPKLSLPGGVTSLFNILQMDKYYDDIMYFEISNSLPKIISIPLKYIEFIITILRFDLIHLNPSFNKKSFVRDAIYALTTKLLKKKLIVYWHGWDNKFEDKVQSSTCLKILFNLSYKKANCSIVLGTIFKNKLINLGYTNKIVIETNTAENDFIDTEIIRSINNKKEIKLLFLSRIEEEKGIFTAIDTLMQLNRTQNSFKLYIAGSGSLENEIKKIAESEDNIVWVGYVDALKKHQLLLDSDIMFFPTFYPEGMPLTLLEAMMYGLPIVSRPVGGIPDIVENNINGKIDSSLTPDVFAELIRNLALPEVYEKISKNNIIKSKAFTPANFRKRLIQIYETVYK